MRIYNSRVHIEPGPLVGALALYALAVRTRPGQIVDQVLMVRASYTSARVFASDFVALTSPYISLPADRSWPCLWCSAAGR